MSRSWTKHFVLIPTLTFLVIAGGLVAIWYRLHAIEGDMVDERTRTTTEQVAFRFENFIGARLHLVDQMTRQWLRNQIKTPERFREVALSIKSEFKSFQAINWVDAQGVIRWVVPEEDNLPAKDRDLGAHAGVAELLRDVAARGAPRASGPLTLFQGGRGFGTYFPILRNRQCEGFINGVFRMDQLVADCLHRGVLEDFYLQLRDGGETLFINGPSGVFDRSPHACSYRLRVLDREWTVTLVPMASVIKKYMTPADEVFLVTGLLLAAGLAWTLKAYLRRQDALQQSERRLRLAVENMPAMVAAFDHRGQIIVWNRHCEAVTGYPAAEIVDNPAVSRLLQSRRVDGQVSERRPFGLAEGADQEWLITCQDGSVRAILWSNASAGLSVPGWASWGVGTDITERRKAEDALRLTRFAMDSAAVSTFWIQKDARISYANQAACTSLGYSPEELLQLRVFDLDPNFHSEMWAPHWERVNSSQGRPVSFESIHRRKDGTTFPVEITTNPLCYKGEFSHFAFAKDITERKRAEEERLAIERGLLETQKLESLGLLAGGVAHDFNNLLTAMMGTVSLARQMVPAESTLGEYLQHVESAAQQAADLARQLLAYSGKGKFVLTAVDLRSVIEETGHLLRVSIPKSVDVVYQLGEVPVCTKADAAQMRQIVMNLVINAAEAIGEFPGTVTVRTCQVQADRTVLADMHSDTELEEGPYALLEVTDTGCGMDAALRARIFEPFFSTKSTGRGLGLAAVLGIVRGHRGGIRIESQPGRGTVVRVLLPACEAPAVVDPISAPAQTAPAGGTILVVDDEPSVRTVAKIILQDSGYSVLVAADGQEAVEAFRRNADEIQVVLLDLTMPRMDGREVLNVIRGIRPQVRVLLSSGYDEQEAATDLAGSPITQFMQKPYRADQLLQKLQDLLAG